LHSLRSQDSAIANNFAFFAALTGHDTVTAERVARENHERQPADLTYRATYGFVLCVRDRADEAVILLKAVSAESHNSAAVAFAYGLALARTGHKAEARALLNSLDLAAFTTQEVKLIQAALN
jgi:Flp pilus assembly protein TadD